MVASDQPSAHELSQFIELNKAFIFVKTTSIFKYKTKYLIF